MSLFGLGASKPSTVPDVVKVSVSGCQPAAGGVGIDLTQTNVILDIRPDTAAARALAAAEAAGTQSENTYLQVGDRVLSVDGVALRGRILTEVIQPADTHEFEVERVQGWSGFSIDEMAAEDADDDDGFGTLNRLRTVTVRKTDGQLGLHPEVYCADGVTSLLRISRVYPNSHASATGVLSPGDVLKSINGQSLACGLDDGGDSPLDTATRVLAEAKDGDELVLEIESDVLLCGWMQKKGEKAAFGLGAPSWQRRWCLLVWSETNMAEREIRYFEGHDTQTRKHKGTIDLSKASSVAQKEINGSAGLTIDTPGRVWELLPEGREAAVDWYRLLSSLVARKKGLAVTASLSNAIDEVAAIDEGSQVPGELSVRLTRKLGLSINKLGNEIVIAELEPDGAAAACGLLSPGDALDEVNGTKTESCKQTIKLLMANPSAAQLKVFSKVVHGGWMHKLGEGLGGWTTRYFTLTYELDPTSVPGAGSKAADPKADAKRERPRATSIAASGGASTITVHLHKAHRTDKLGVSLAEDHEGRVLLQRLYEGYIAASSGSLLVGDVLLSINGKPVPNQPTAHKFLSEAIGSIELSVYRAQESGCWMLRYYDGKNAATRAEKGCIALSKGSVREINKYTLQDDGSGGGSSGGGGGEGDVPRVGLYILQDERCWELLPPEEELDMWLAKLQLAVFGQEVIAHEYVTTERATASAQKVRDLKGAHYLTLQQQYGLMLATYKERDGDAGNAATPGGLATFRDRPNSNVYIMSLEVDGAGACSGLLAPDDRILSVDGVPAESLQQVASIFRDSRHIVTIRVCSKVVFGGWLYKKGEVNTALQLRWFTLSDDEALGGGLLRYYDGKNAVSRTLKGEIKVTPGDVSMVRTFTHEQIGGAEKRLGVRITTPSRVWELVAHQSDAEARRWAEMLSVRIRRRVHRPTISHMADSTDAQQIATIGSKEAGTVPQCTRL